MQRRRGIVGGAQAGIDYGEARFVTLGMVRDVVVSIAHTESHGVIRIISFRKATKHEQAIYFRQIQN